VLSRSAAWELVEIQLTPKIKSKATVRGVSFANSAQVEITGTPSLRLSGNELPPKWMIDNVSAAAVNDSLQGEVMHGPGLELRRQRHKTRGSAKILVCCRNTTGLSLEIAVAAH
jgi:hypothetical protein